MQADIQAQVAFFLTGRRSAGVLDPVDGIGLQPALLSRYGQLSSLRYDYPLVLAPGGRVEALSALFDAAIQSAAKGADGDRVRMLGLRLEAEIRSLVAGGATGSLSDLSETAARRMAGPEGTIPEPVQRVRAALSCNGALADCDRALAGRLLRHLWTGWQEAKAAAFMSRVNRAVLRLAALLKADEQRSAASYSPERLRSSMGPGFAAVMDFDVMSKMMVGRLSCARMPMAQRRRIEGLLRVLKAQRFFAVRDGAAPYSFVFETCAAALKAARERELRQVELARALAVAQLEIDGAYDPERHDAVFESYALAHVDAAERAAFPDYLVLLDASALQGGESARLTELLSSGLPIKVLLRVDDLHGDAALATQARQVAQAAMGLATAYVMQASASHLYRFRDNLTRGFAFPGPALFSVYSGAGAVQAVPPYVMAAAAMESRAFPAFTFDPSAGNSWADRFRLDGNRQVDLDWPVQAFSYEDEDHQGVSQDLPFTVVDFLAADARLAPHLARVPRQKWNGSLLPVDEALKLPDLGLPDKVPGVLMVDAQQRLQRVVVDQALLREAGRCRDVWHSLQELAGVHNSHAERLLAREQQAWQERLQAQPVPAAAALVQPAASASAPAEAPEPAVAAAEEPQRDPDEAYIETARCSSCNECTLVNPRMFAYDANQQAYIADISAGTYAQLVEAAENCQVAVIHPGKPRNRNEPGLEELERRAEAFN